MAPSKTPASRLVSRLVRGARLVPQGGCFLMCEVSASGARLSIDAQSAVVYEALTSLARGGVDMTVIASSLTARGQVDEAKCLQGWLRKLQEAGCLEYAWGVDDRDLLIVSDLCREFQLADRSLEPITPIVLSRFAYVRRDADGSVLESPEALCRLVPASHEVWNWLARLWTPTSTGALLAAGAHEAAALAEVLWRTGFLEVSGLSELPARAAWEFHDLLFHWRSRGGRVTGPQGGTYRHIATVPAPPAIKNRMPGSVVVLPKPHEDGVASLTAVIERRRTNREQGARPMTLAELGRLLYHALRVQRRLPGEYQELLLRPTPAAGAIHELEAYLVVSKCERLDRGLYHYHAEQHTLHRLAATDSQVGSLLDDAALAWAKPDDPPQVLIILASRLPRLAWKYEGIAYRLTLLNAGAVIQTLYLLATEMRLACSAIGGGDSAAFAAATGLDPMSETSVAEFAVGAGN